MSKTYQTFFDDYANAINQQNFQQIKRHFKLPFILVHDEPRSVVSFDQELERKMKNFLLNLKQQGVESLAPQVHKVLSVSEDMTFVSVNWVVCDMLGEQSKQYINSYILSEQGEDKQIVTLIVDDKYDLFSQLLK